jgi:capsular polysaccharide biosynthesis protein
MDGAPPHTLLVRDIRDMATHAADQRTPRIGFIQIAPAGRSLSRPPLFLLGPASPSVLRDLCAQTATPALGCYTLDDAIVAPTGFPIMQGTAFHGDAFLHPRHLVVSISDRLNAETLKTRHVPGTTAVLCGPAHETYGHWLVDFLPRLWVLRRAGHDLDRLQFLVPADLRPFAFALLRLCGIADRQLIRYHHWNEILHVERLVMPTGLRQGDRLSPCFAHATAFWRDRAALQAAPGSGGAIFLSRGAGSQRRLVNRARIEAIAAEHGLAVMRPEDLSLTDQIALFTSADILAGEYGSALHNVIFAGAGAAVCALRGTSRHPSLVQSGIATALAQEVGYVFGATEGGEAEQAFCVEEAHFHLALELLQLRQTSRHARQGVIASGREAITP